MILGIGTDIVDIRGFAEQLQQPGSTFLTGNFTLGERGIAKKRPGQQPERHLAARFAAKEAFVKAWSAAHGGHRPAASSVDFREIEVVSDALNRPSFRLGGEVAQAVARLGRIKTHLSLSHDGDYASAFVILEQLATGTLK